METFSTLRTFYAGNSPVTCEFPAQRPVNVFNLMTSSWHAWVRILTISEKTNCVILVGKYFYVWDPLCTRASRAPLLTMTRQYQVGSYSLCLCVDEYRQWILLWVISGISIYGIIHHNGIWPPQGAVSIRKTVLPGMAIPMLKIRRPNGRLIFNMEIAIRR